MRGGDKIDDIQSQLDSIKLQLDELRNKSSDVKSDNDSIMEEEKFMKKLICGMKIIFI